MPSSSVVSFKLDMPTAEILEQLSAKQHISKSALIRKLIDSGLEKELAKESIDFVRTQIHEEIQSTCFPQFDRLAKLEAKIGYQSVASFYLLAYIMDRILPESKKQDFGEITQEAKAMAIAYLKPSEKDFADIAKSEANAIAKLKF